MKKLLAFAICLTMVASLFTATAAAATAAGGSVGQAVQQTIAASPTSSAVLVDGRKVAFDSYNINGSNYFKLRDIAYIINGTAKQFSVDWDNAANAITLASGKPYVAVGGEMDSKGTGAKVPKPTNSKILLDGNETKLSAYKIDGNNYFKLRDIGAAFDFGVTWDRERNTIVIDTSKGYTPENPVVTITMENGKQIVIELYPDKAPNTVNNFISLVKSGFYDGLKFHRVVPDFVIQGGSPNGDGRGGPGYSIKGEFRSNGFKGNDLSHQPGVISMARSESYDSAGSQFFICAGRSAAGLDGDYAAFGMVTSGMDEVYAISKLNTNDGPPSTPQIMKTVTVNTFGAEYPEPVKVGD